MSNADKSPFALGERVVLVERSNFGKFGPGNLDELIALGKFTGVVIEKPEWASTPPEPYTYITPDSPEWKNINVGSWAAGPHRIWQRTDQLVDYRKQADINLSYWQAITGGEE